jgi:predicted CXXCH cytochrome family protein
MGRNDPAVKGGFAMKAANILFSVLFAVQVLLLPGCVTPAHKDELTTGGAVPAIKKDCKICHGSHGRKEGAVLLIRPIETLCVECHADRMSSKEHKIDVVPTMKGKDLPLKNNRMTCITCHDPHRNKYGSMLRMPEPDLCLQCHPV